MRVYACVVLVSDRKREKEIQREHTKVTEEEIQKYKTVCQSPYSPSKNSQNQVKLKEVNVLMIGSIPYNNSNPEKKNTKFESDWCIITLRMSFRNRLLNTELSLMQNCIITTRFQNKRQVPSNLFYPSNSGTLVKTPDSFCHGQFLFFLSICEKIRTEFWL